MCTRKNGQQNAGTQVHDHQITVPLHLVQFEILQRSQYRDNTDPASAFTFYVFAKMKIAIGIFNFKYAFKLTFNLVAYPNKRIQANSTYIADSI